jgi:hypothetical protein
VPRKEKSQDPYPNQHLNHPQGRCRNLSLTPSASPSLKCSGLWKGMGRQGKCTSFRWQEGKPPSHLSTDSGTARGIARMSCEQKPVLKHDVGEKRSCWKREKEMSPSVGLFSNCRTTGNTALTIVLGRCLVLL